MFVDPKFVKDKKRFINIITPLVYLHLCQINGFDKTSQEDCVRNVESFSKKEILPKAPEFMYYGDGNVTTGYDSYDWTGYWANYQSITTKFMS